MGGGDLPLSDRNYLMIRNDDDPVTSGDAAPGSGRHLRTLGF